MKLSELKNIIKETTKNLINEAEPCANGSGNVGDECIVGSCCVGGQFLNCPGRWDCDGCVLTGGPCNLSNIAPPSGLNPTRNHDFESIDDMFALGDDRFAFGNDRNMIREAEECCKPHTLGIGCWVYLNGAAHCAGKWNCSCNKCICKGGGGLSTDSPQKLRRENIEHLNGKDKLRHIIRESIKELVNEQDLEMNKGEESILRPSSIGSSPCSGYGQSWVTPGDIMWDYCLQCFQHGNQGAPNTQFPNGWDWTATVGVGCECCVGDKSHPDDPLTYAKIVQRDRKNRRIR